MLDLVGLLASDKISLSDAEVSFERAQAAAIAGEIDDLYTYLGMSNWEGKAYAHGATLEALARMRNEGWPDRCCRCGDPIEIEGLWVFRYGLGGVPALRHLTCPRPALDRPLCDKIWDGEVD